MNGPGRLAAAGLLALGGGCVDVSLVADTAFPAVVPGLPDGAAWLSLPVRSWVLEGGIEPRAIAACLPPACQVPAAVGVFAARGAAAVELGRTLDDPARLARALGRTTAARRPPAAAATPGTAVVAERRREDGLRAFAIRLARPDGTGAAAGYVIARREPGRLALVLVVAPDEEAARRIARAVAPHLE